MATLAADKPRQFENTGGHPDYNEIPIIASDTVYNGAAVGESASTGTGRPLVAGDNFCGFCIEKCANEGGASNAANIKLLQSGVVWLTVTNGDNVDDFGDTVQASDDDTFAMGSGTTNTSIGKLKRYDQATGKSLIYFEAKTKQSL